MIEILALIVAILTAGYTIYDRHQVRQSQKRTEESQKRLEKRLDSPKVVASLRRDEVWKSCLIVCVENVGTGAAKNVQFQPSDPSLKTVSEISLGDIGFIKNGIDYFGSRQKYEFPINTIRGKEAWNELMQTPLKITITYENSAGEKQPDEHAHLDFGVFESVPLVKSLIGAIAGTAEEMVKLTKEMVKATKDVGRKLNQYTHIRAGDKVRTTEELPAMIDGDYSRITTIPKDAICTVLEVTQEDITIEWDDAPEEGGRVVYRGWRTLSEPFAVKKINLPPKQ